VVLQRQRGGDVGAGLEDSRIGQLERGQRRIRALIDCEVSGGAQVALCFLHAAQVRAVEGEGVDLHVVIIAHVHDGFLDVRVDLVPGKRVLVGP
jgi:hypothetical protein